MKNLTIFSFLLAISISIHKTHASIPNQNPTEFIRKSCASTLYPNLCFASLSPYASTINENPLKLSQIAIHLTYDRVKSVKSRVSSFLVSNLSASRSSTTKCLKDCAQMLSDAADLTRSSMLELKKLQRSANGTEYEWRLSNVQTWMSAALTNEDTCVGGLVHGSGGFKSDFARYVDQKVGVAEEYTSVALALVNKLANV